MKAKIAIAISNDVLLEVDRLAGPKRSRSVVIERILREYFRDHANAALQRRDLELLDKAADRLNREADDVLTYQA
jgi:hypothetical protein